MRTKKERVCRFVEKKSGRPFSNVPRQHPFDASVEANTIFAVLLVEGWMQLEKGSGRFPSIPFLRTAKSMLSTSKRSDDVNTQRQAGAAGPSSLLCLAATGRKLDRPTVGHDCGLRLMLRRKKNLKPRGSFTTEIKPLHGLWCARQNGCLGRGGKHLRT